MVPKVNKDMPFEKTSTDTKELIKKTDIKFNPPMKTYNRY